MHQWIAWELLQISTLQFHRKQAGTGSISIIGGKYESAEEDGKAKRIKPIK